MIMIININDNEKYADIVPILRDHVDDKSWIYFIIAYYKPNNHHIRRFNILVAHLNPPVFRRKLGVAKSAVE